MPGVSSTILVGPTDPVDHAIRIDPRTEPRGDAHVDPPDRPPGGTDAERARRELLAGLSHALRTPLHQATGLVHLLERAKAEADGPRFATFLGYLDTSCRELHRRIDALLEHAHRCTSVPDLRAFDVGELLSPLIGTFRALAQRRGQRLTVVAEPALGVHADPDMLRDAIAVLVGNALAYTPDGGHVSVRAHAVERDRVRIEVQDDGVGIADADLPRLFVEFVRLPAAEARQPDGLGLGLARCRRTVGAMGGHIEVVSRLDHGSVFSIVLPRHRA